VVLLVSRQGKVRLTKFYDQDPSKKEKQRLVREVTASVLGRSQKMCNFIEYKGKKIVYKRYASLFFVCVVGGEVGHLLYIVYLSILYYMTLW
jgi:AP-1 complex subunit sigma 1/2